ncbi:MAG: MFS transporter [Actinomycetota bacterium]
MTDIDDEAPAGGSARAALTHRDFRIVFAGSFVSNIGRWMQNVVLTAFAWELTERPSFVSLVVFAQLGPMLLLSIVGGTLADSLDRRRLLLATQVWQAAWTFVLAAAVLGDDIAEWLLVVLVFIIGLGQAIFAPTWSAVLPTIAGRENLAAAISLNSTQMNASRVVGPALGGVLWVATDASTVFVVNGVSYVFVIGALLAAAIPAVERPATGSGWERITAGIRVVRRRPRIRNSLLLMAMFAFWCLPFIGQMPTLAELNLGIDAKSGSYGVLYATFGSGAVIGALLIGTLLLHTPKPRVVRGTLLLFSAALAVLALMRDPLPAFPVIFVVGMSYFATTTALMTHVQGHIEDEIRGRVMALWTMAFGGMVPLSNLIAGPLIERTSVTAVVLGGAVAALVLALTIDLEPMSTPPR